MVKKKTKFFEFFFTPLFSLQNRRFHCEQSLAVIASETQR